MAESTHDVTRRLLDTLAAKSRERWTGACDTCNTKLTPYEVGSGDLRMTIYPTTCDACLAAEQERERDLRRDAAWRAWVARFHLPMPLLDRAGDAEDVLHPRALRVLNLTSAQRRHAPCGLWLTGATGTGKTTQLMAIAECAWRGRWADNHSPWIVYITLADMMRHQGTEGFGQTLAGAEVLIIDELVPRAVYDSIGDWFSAVLNERYAARRLTFFASNYSPDEMLNAAGGQAGRRPLMEARDVDRVYSMIGGSGGVVEFTQDHRQGELMEFEAFWGEED